MVLLRKSPPLPPFPSPVLLPLAAAAAAANDDGGKEAGWKEEEGVGSALLLVVRLVLKVCVCGEYIYSFSPPADTAYI